MRAEHGIPFSPPMVRALVAGAKTVTRRLEAPDALAGDLLWVREAWAIARPDTRAWEDIPVAEVVYSSTAAVPAGWRRRHARFMPKCYARIWLLVEDVGQERLHAIDDADARAEGVLTLEGVAGATTPRDRFAALWDEINGDTAPWASNPWVWRIAFRRVEHPGGRDAT